MEESAHLGQITFCQVASRQYWEVSTANNDSQGAFWALEADEFCGQCRGLFCASWPLPQTGVGHIQVMFSCGCSWSGFHACRLLHWLIAETFGASQHMPLEVCALINFSNYHVH